MKTSIELKSELSELESLQVELKQEIAQLERRLTDAKQELLELEGRRNGRYGKIHQKKCELLQVEDRENAEKSPIAQWLNPKKEIKRTITVSKVTPKRVYLRSFDDLSLSREMVFSRETGKATYYYSSSDIDKDLVLDVEATVKAWEAYIAGGVPA